MEHQSKHIIVLGIRGIPARHGGFETFAEHLALFLISRDWRVTVYCQEEGAGPTYTTTWEGVDLVHIPAGRDSAVGSIIFDVRSIIHSLSQDGIFLTLGYNTSILNILHRLFRKTNIINMDGIEWRRQKWGKFAKAWFWINEKVACVVGNHLIADNPGIASHLASGFLEKKITMIPYGSTELKSADQQMLSTLKLDKETYALVVARAEPENSILEIVTAFSRIEHSLKLVILGNFEPLSNPYHKAVMEAASDEVIFPGPIYDKEILAALRFYARFHIHGHQVGGTNPSLVEALGAGSAIISRDNTFNRWVAKDAALYFDSEMEASQAIDRLIANDQLVGKLRAAARINFEENFKWDSILAQYECLLLKYLPNSHQR